MSVDFQTINSFCSFDLWLLSIGIFSKCNLGRAIKESRLDTPPPRELPDSDVVLPYVILGDEAFPLLNNLMKPYPRNQSLADRSKAIFNYRLSRARRIVENAFGILTHRFRLFATPIHLGTESVQNATTAACIIHNLLIDERTLAESDTISSNLSSIDFSNEEALASNEPQNIRDQFKEYFMTTGIVSWQNDTFRI